MARVLHISDWHGRLPSEQFPEADVYVMTGDMFPNWPQRGKHGRMIDRELEFRKQGEWIDHMDRRGLYRRMMPESCREKYWILCRGNHDFVDLAPLVEGGPFFEVAEDPRRVQGIEIPGWSRWLSVAGVRGINYIAGEWSDELLPHDFNDRFHEFPAAVDLLVTHAPPYGILDESWGHWGSPAIRNYLEGRWVRGEPPMAHCFGHIHEDPRVVEHGGTKLSNAATTTQVFDIFERKG